MLPDSLLLLTVVTHPLWLLESKLRSSERAAITVEPYLHPLCVCVCACVCMHQICMYIHIHLKLTMKVLLRAMK